MSSNAAIAAVTATLTNMIQAAVATDDAVSSGTVTARPPDRARQGAPINQVNLFLYRTSIDAAWRNQDPPSIRPGETGQPPLPIVLSYLITAYGEDDDEILAHRLLGIAMSVLNDRPLLSRTQIAKALAGSGLESQIERVRITPDPRPQDEISRMWATFGTGYRLSVSYDAAVVLIDSTREIVAPTPVLMRGRGDTGPAVAGVAFPAIQQVTPPNRQPAAQPGDVLTLTGTHLDAVTKLTVSHPALSQTIDLAPLAATAGQVTAQLPEPPTIPAGVATVVAAFDALMDGETAAGATTVTSNGAPVALAPKIVSDAPLQASLAADGSARVTVTCSPPVQQNQTIALVVGTALVPLAPVQAASSELTFTLTGIAKGAYTLRLRIDSVDSIPVVIGPPPVSPNTPAPMTFDPHQQLVIS